MGNYIHINDILNFVNFVERKKFKIINSKDFGFDGDMAFKAIIPEDFKVSRIVFSEDMNGDIFRILNNKGKDAMIGPNVIMWTNELYSTADETSVLIFNHFRGIPEIVSSSLIMSTIK